MKLFEARKGAKRERGESWHFAMLNHVIRPGSKLRCKELVQRFTIVPTNLAETSLMQHVERQLRQVAAD